jgi:hypothetical protein
LIFSEPLVQIKIKMSSVIIERDLYFCLLRRKNEADIRLEFLHQMADFTSGFEWLVLLSIFHRPERKTV